MVRCRLCRLFGLGRLVLCLKRSCATACRFPSPSGTGFGWPYINFRRENGVLILIIVIVGLVSAFVSLYRIVRAQSQKMLAKFEEVVMEVQDDEHGQTYQANRQGTATTPAAAAAAAGGVAAGPAHAHAMDGMQYIRLRAGMR